MDGIEQYDRFKPDMVFLDLKMPRMDGVGVLRHVRQTNKDVTIYIVTAFAKEYMDQLAKARDEGLAFEVASKPLNSQQINAIARSILTDN